MAFSAWYSIVVGVLMLAQWVVFLVLEQVPEAVTAPTQLAFHLAAEGMTAVALLVTGGALLLRISWGRRFAVLATGMLLYTLIVSPGYFAQRGEWPFVGMFAVLLAGALYSLSRLMRRPSAPPAA